MKAAITVTTAGSGMAKQQQQQTSTEMMKNDGKFDKIIFVAVCVLLNIFFAVAAAAVASEPFESKKKFSSLQPRA